MYLRIQRKAFKCKLLDPLPLIVKIQKFREEPGNTRPGRSPCVQQMLLAPGPPFEKSLCRGSMCLRELIVVAGIHLEMYSSPDSICPRKTQKLLAVVL